jgi:spectrin beta
VEAERLIQSFPETEPQLRDRLEDMLAVWRTLVRKAEARKGKLDESEQLQRFVNDFRDLSSWISDMRSLLLADELAIDVSGAEALILRHREHKAEMDAREGSFQDFSDRGEELVAAEHYATDEILDKMSVLANQRKDLHSVWEKRMKQFDDCLDTQKFRRDAEQAEGWIGLREAFLANEALGESLEGVETLIKMQDDFEKTLAAQEEKFQALNRETAFERAERLSREAEVRRQEKARLERIEEQRRHDEIVRQQQLERQRQLERQKMEEEKRRRDEEAERKRQADIEADRLKKAAEAEATAKAQAEKLRLDNERLEREKEQARLDEQKKLEQIQKMRQQEEIRLKEQRELQLRRPACEPAKPEQSQTQAVPVPSEMSPTTDKVDKEGILQRKNELDEGGRKAAARSWRPYYTVLTNQLLNFYREQRDFLQNIPSAPAINVSSGDCEVAKDYTKKKHVLRLKLNNGAEYLFLARDNEDMLEWVRAIKVGASKRLRRGPFTATDVVQKTGQTQPRMQPQPPQPQTSQTQASQPQTSQPQLIGLWACQLTIIFVTLCYCGSFRVRGCLLLYTCNSSCTVCRS